MNRQQKLCLWVGIYVFVLMGVFPPWYHTENAWSSYEYRPLWNPPSYRRHVYYQSGPAYVFYQLDAHRLWVQWAMVAAVTAGLLLTCRRQNNGA